MNKEKTIFLITIVTSIILLIVITAISVIFSKENEENSFIINRSIYNKKPTGYAAWYQVVTDSKIKIKVWKNTFASLDKVSKNLSTMIIVSPTEAPGQDLMDSIDIDHLLKWVNAGNTLIYLDDFRTQDSRRLLNRLNMDYNYKATEDNPKYKDSDKFKLLYSDEKTIFDVKPLKAFNYKAKKISTSCKVRLAEKNIEPLLKDSDGLVMGKRSYGKGEIYVLTMPDLVENGSLYEKEDNYQFLTNLVHQDNSEIYINEYIHGYTIKDDIFDYYQSTLLNPISKQIFLILLILIWSVSRRFGRIRPLEEPSRATNMEYIDAMANLYKKAALTGTALLPIYNQFRMSLCNSLRVDQSISDNDLFEAVRRSFSMDEAKEIINIINKASQATKSNDISKQDMLDLGKKLNHYRIKGLRYGTRS